MANERKSHEMTEAAKTPASNQARKTETSEDRQDRQ